MTELPDLQTSAESGISADAKPNPVERMVEVLTDPFTTMRSIAARPDVLVPLLTIVLLSIVTTWLMAPRLDFTTEMRAQMENRGIPATTIDRQIEVIEKGQQFMMPLMAGLSPLFIAVIAGVLLGGFRLMGGEGGYKQAYSIVTYSWIPAVLKGLVATGIVLFSEDVIYASRLATIVPTNLGFLTTPVENPAMFSLLSSLDLVTFWMLALMGIGFSYAAKMPRGRSIGIVVTMWAVVVLIRTGLATLQS